MSLKNDSGISILLPWNWFNSGKVEIKLLPPIEKDDVDLIYKVQKQILEKEKNNNKIEIVDFNNVLFNLN